MTNDRSIETSSKDNGSDRRNPFTEKRRWKSDVVFFAFLLVCFVVLLGGIVASGFALQWIPLWLLVVFWLLPVVVLVLSFVVIASGILEQKIDHPRFGRLVYEKLSQGGGIWEGVVPFPPAGEPISISMPGNQQGPGERFEELYRNLVERFAQLLPQISEAGWPSYHAWCGEMPDAADNPKQLETILKLSSCSLIDAETAVVFLEYVVPQETGGHVLLVLLEDWHVEDAHWEG